MDRAYPCRRIAFALLACLVTACGDGTTSPPAAKRGVLQLLVLTSGGDPDIDGYDIVVDSITHSLPAARNSQEILLAAGLHTITLENVAETCTVTGPRTRSAAITAEHTSDVVFEVVCATTGVAVTASTTGVDRPSSYQVSVDDRVLGAVGANGSAMFGRLLPGMHLVRLVLADTTCRMSGADQAIAEVTPRAVTPVQFQVICVTPKRPPKIAYQIDTVVNGVLRTAIAVANVDGSDAEVLRVGSSPSWSPGGTRLVFSDLYCDYDDSYSYNYGFNCSGGLIIVDPESRSATRLTDEPAYAPAWAPTSDGVAAMIGSSMAIVTFDGLPSVRVGTFGMAVGDPTWSPDGDRMAFTCQVGDSRPGICIAKRDGKELARVTAATMSAFDPAWSPDGKRIAFTTGQDIALLTLDGGDISRLTQGSEPAWSPDGSKLVFRSQADGLFTINADGSNRQRLTTGNHHAPAWRP
jgi:hypothetical protein